MRRSEKIVSLTQEVLLALEGALVVAEGEVREAEVAVGSAHAHAVLGKSRQLISKQTINKQTTNSDLLVPGERQVLVVVADGLLVVAEAVVCVAEEVAGLGLALHVAQLLAQHEVVLVEGHGLRIEIITLNVSKNLILLLAKLFD